MILAPSCSSHRAGSFKSSFKDRSWTDPGSILDRSRIDPGSILDRSWIGPGPWAHGPMGPTHFVCRRMILAGAKILAKMCIYRFVINLAVFHETNMMPHCTIYCRLGLLLQQPRFHPLLDREPLRYMPQVPPSSFCWGSVERMQ